MKNSKTNKSFYNLSIPKPIKPHVHKNYFGSLPLSMGIVFGLMGSLLIMGLIAVLTQSTGQDIGLAPRIVASALIGESAETGLFPIILGTMIHLLSGAMYGALFAVIMPRLPRPFWIVFGLIYGMGIWVIALIGLPLLIDTGNILPSTYFSILLISHVVFGLNLGLAGCLYGVSESEEMSY